MSEDDSAAKAAAKARARALVRTLSLQGTAPVTETCRSVEEAAEEEGSRRRFRFESYRLFARAAPVPDELTGAVGGYTYPPTRPRACAAPAEDIVTSV